MTRICPCGQVIPNGKIIDGKHRNLQNRTRCLDCMPFGQSRYKKKSDEEKRAKNAAKAKRHYDKYKNKYGVDPINVLRNKRRESIINAIGGKCQICGYDKLRANLAFHHLRYKSFPLDIRRFQYRYEIIMNEVRKCVLICHNCHGEVHGGLIQQSIIDDAHARLLSSVKSVEYPTVKEVEASIRENKF